ncbi:MAG: Maf family protein [Perlucidibaca sp.]
MAALYLASTSPRRHELLRQIGLRPEPLPVSVDESVRPGEGAEAYVLRLARAKAEAGAAALVDAGAWVLAADTTVFAGGQILGKPADFEDACRIWALLPAADHQVLTGVALIRGGQRLSRVVSTRVRFRAIPAGERLAYWNSGEPQDKAGGYAIQGRAALYVDGIEGSYSNVVGLPLAETAELLRLSQFPLWE